MSSVDNKVVVMKFDNKSFEDNMSTTMRSLQKLKDSLAFTGGAKGMEDVQAASQNVTLSGMGTAIDGVSARFVALSTIAITALSNITNRAVDAGINIAKSLTLDQVMSGFQEYELNMNSIQTILANTKSKGSTLEDVNKALDELNTYADQTIYNFAEMSRNIGTFTAAGVDLDTSVSSIKGIANLAAISGSSSMQASTAMYQLSQAIAAGSVKLMDWNSVVNAGMGGEVFQKALFESGKALKTIEGVGIDTTFEQWTAAGNTFRGSLEKGWLTSEVLTSTLQGFTGDLTEAQIMAMGYTAEQTKAIMEMGTIGKEAATKVKTFTQLIDTIKEGVGSSWATTFRTIIGDFEEARVFFSSMGTYLGGILDKSADARNNMLNGWKFLGGRDALIQTLVHAFAALESVVKPIKEAFRDIFPQQTAEGLYAMTVNLRDFVANLKMGDETMAKVANVFRGFFATIEIGFVILKEIGKTFISLIKSLTGVGEGASGALNAFSGIGDFLTKLNAKLVEGGGIINFFDKFREGLSKFVAFIGLDNIVNKIADALVRFKDILVNVFTGKVMGDAEDMSNAMGGISERFDWLGSSSEKLGSRWDTLSEKFTKVKDSISGFVETIKTELTGVWGRIGDNMKTGDFDKILDIVNVGLIGGIVLLIRKLMNGGINLDFGGGLMEGLTDSLGALTDHLQAMQMGIKADAILKIAGALAILTASVVVLSGIDSVALTRALTALSLGFAGIVASMSSLSQLSTGIKLPLLAASIVAFSGAILILAIAAKSIASLGWEELTRGLLGVGAMLAMVTVAAGPLSKLTGGMISAGIGMIGISAGLLVLTFAVKGFAEMSWDDLKKGLLGAALGLGAITLAMQFIPDGMVAKGVGIIAIAAGLHILASAVVKFGDMNMDVLKQGLIAVGVALLGIALATSIMPPSLPLIAVGLIMIGAALNIMVLAISGLGNMDLNKMVQGIAGLAAVLLILAIATLAMSGAIVGAVAIAVVAGSLWILTGVLQALSKLSLAELGMGLLAIAAVLVMLGYLGLVLTPIIPAMLGLGAAMILVGAGFTLFGAGLLLAATALAALGGAGYAAVRGIIAILNAVILKVPEFIVAVVDGILKGLEKILEAAPAMVRAFVGILSEMLDGINKLVPKIGEVIGTLIETMVGLINDHAGSIIDAGVNLLMLLLQGIAANISNIALTVGDIIAGFLNALRERIPQIVTAGVNLLVEFLSGIAEGIPQIVTAAVKVITEFITAIGNNVGRVITAGASLIANIITGIVGAFGDIVTAGADALAEFIRGMTDNVLTVTDAATDMITAFIDQIGESATDIATAGATALVNFLSGITTNVQHVIDAGGDLIVSVIEGIGENLTDIIDAGAKLITDFITGIGQKATDISTAAAWTIAKFLGGLADNIIIIVNAGWMFVLELLRGLRIGVEVYLPLIIDEGWKLGAAIANGVIKGLGDKAWEVAKKGYDVLTGWMPDTLKFWEVNSPSRKTTWLAKMIADGLIRGLDQNTSKVGSSAANMGKNVHMALSTSLNEAMHLADNMAEFNPTITPVLDLSNIQSEASRISDILGTTSIVPETSFNRAASLSNASFIAEEVQSEQTSAQTPVSFTYEQTINSPTPLTTTQIYRDSKSAITKLKEELDLP